MQKGAGSETNWNMREDSSYDKMEVDDDHARLEFQSWTQTQRSYRSVFIGITNNSYILLPEWQSKERSSVVDLSWLSETEEEENSTRRK